MQEPDNEDNLAQQLEALEKAAKKAQQKLQDLQEKKRQSPLEKGGEAQQEEDEESYSYYYSPTPPRKASKKGKSKGRSKTKSLEKDRSLSVRRTRVAKDGQKEKLLQVKEEEKDEQALGKASSSVVPGNANEEKKEEQALEKAPSMEKQALEKEALEKEAKLALEKATSSDNKEEKPEQNAASSVTLTPAKKCLPEEGKEALEKAPSNVVLKAAPPKKLPRVVVDWHNSLEKEDCVPDSHQEALERLMEVAEVHVLSYVNTIWRQGQVHQDVRDQVRAMHRLGGVHTTWQKCGSQGKAAWCKYLGATAIFDDDERICVECFGKGIDTFALMSGHSHHNYIPARCVFRDFVEAVDEYIERLAP